MGNNMFAGFSNLETTYNPNSFQPKYPTNVCPMPTPTAFSQPKPNKPFEIKDLSGIVRGYFWYFGNSVDLVFTIDGEITFSESESYLSAADVLNELTIDARFYDFNMKPVLDFSNRVGAERQIHINNVVKNISTSLYEDPYQVNGAEIVISIDQDTSMELVKGTYRLELLVSHPSGYCETLFGTDTCVFEVR